MQQTIPIKGHRRIKGISPATRKILKLAKTPMKKSSEIVIEISKNEVEKILKEIHKTPKKSLPPPSNSSSSEKKRRKNQVENLQSDLSPKYIGISPGDGKRSRYGRQQRYKEPEDFLPTNIACYVRRTPSKLKITSPGRIFERKFVSYESPIEKLINKNKFLANIMTSPPCKDSENILTDSNINEIEKTPESIPEEISKMERLNSSSEVDVSPIDGGLSGFSPIASSSEENSAILVTPPEIKDSFLTSSTYGNSKPQLTSESTMLCNFPNNSNLDNNNIETTTPNASSPRATSTAVVTSSPLKDSPKNSSPLCNKVTSPSKLASVNGESTMVCNSPSNLNADNNIIETNAQTALSPKATSKVKVTSPRIKDSPKTSSPLGNKISLSSKLENLKDENIKVCNSPEKSNLDNKIETAAPIASSSKATSANKTAATRMDSPKTSSTYGNKVTSPKLATVNEENKKVYISPSNSNSVNNKIETTASIALRSKGTSAAKVTSPRLKDSPKISSQIDNKGAPSSKLAASVNEQNTKVCNSNLENNKIETVALIPSPPKAASAVKVSSPRLKDSPKTSSQIDNKGAPSSKLAASVNEQNTKVCNSNLENNKIETVALIPSPSKAASAVKVSLPKLSKDSPKTSSTLCSKATSSSKLVRLSKENIKVPNSTNNIDNIEAIAPTTLPKATAAVKVTSPKSSKVSSKPSRALCNKVAAAPNLVPVIKENTKVSNSSKDSNLDNNKIDANAPILLSPKSTSGVKVTSPKFNKDSPKTSSPLRSPKLSSFKKKNTKVSNLSDNTNIGNNKIDLDNIKVEATSDIKTKEISSNNKVTNLGLDKNKFEDVLSLNFPKLSKGYKDNSLKTSNPLSLKVTTPPSPRLENKETAKTRIHPPKKASNQAFEYRLGSIKNRHSPHTNKADLGLRKQIIKIASSGNLKKSVLANTSIGSISEIDLDLVKTKESDFGFAVIKKGEKNNHGPDILEMDCESNDSLKKIIHPVNSTDACAVYMICSGSENIQTDLASGLMRNESEKLEVVSSVKLGDQMSEMKRTETISAFDLVDHNDKKLKLKENDVNLRFMNISPSTNSTDSAKGSSIDLDMESPVVTGSVFWGRISTYPFWPCIVWPDPKGKTVSTIGKGQLRIHVRFFADNGRRSWVRKSDMLPYSGREEFNRRAQEALSKYNKRHSNYKAYFVSDRNKDLWERAILEANLVLMEPLEMRTLKFDNILDETRKQMLAEKRKKRVSLNESRVSTKYYSGMSEDTCSLFSETCEYSNSIKRDRSPTPESPAYEDIDDLKIFVKRRKIDLNGAQNASTSKSYEELSSLSSEETDYNFEDDEFKRFYDLMKTYTMCYNNEAMEKQLYDSVKQIWIIRNMSRKELKDTSLSSVFSTSEMNIRRLSSRMRTLTKKETLLMNEKDSPGQKVEKKETQKRPSKPLEEVVEDIMELQKNFLFKGLNREPVCKICYKPSNLSKCSGSCQSWVHVTCISLSFTTSAKKPPMLHVTGDLEEHTKEELPANNTFSGVVLCKECRSGEAQKCFVCKKNDPNLGERIKCHWNWCGKVFHLACLKYWPQAKLTKSSAKIESLLCPCHVCHTCVSDDPRGKFLQIDKFKLAKCIECPATYHLDSFCIPAGTQFLTATSLICPRHRKIERNYDKKLQNVNANWCFICATGGSLICCETCPTSFHIECLKISQPEGNYICEECETGRLPLYGEMVWAKLGAYRWWPAIIIPPPEVPKNLMRQAHNKSDFCIRFFGSNDHTWISRNRVFLYQEGDWGRVNANTKGIDQTYKNGLEEARRIFELIKEKKLSQNSEDRDKRLRPLPYVKIKANRPVPPVKLQELDISELTACDCNPSDMNPCGSNSGCLNRLLLTECNPKVCPTGSKCQNQMFEKRLYPSLKVCRTNGKGWGLVSEDDLVAGDFIIEYVGEVIDDAEFQRRIAQKQEERDENYYFLTLEKDYMIDAGPKGNLARFMNHSCEPNCETQKWNVNGVTRVGLFAIKDIPAKTELTFNYNLECIGDDKKVCYCGAERCAGFIGAKYKEPEKVKTSIKKSKAKGTTKRLKKALKSKLPIPNGN